MKKITAFILSIVMMLLYFSSSAFAKDEHTEEPMEILQNAVYYTCDYDVKNNQVIINGTVNHDFMISHADYKIEVRSALSGIDYKSVINDSSYEILAEASMSVKFTFYIKTNTVLERYSNYLILFCSPDGERILAAEPRIPSISSDFEYDSNNRMGYKGIYTESSSAISRSGAGTIVIDVDLEKMKSDSTDSILYPMKDSYIHIRRSYITEIDKKITAASVADTRVYFRILLDASSEFSVSINNAKKYSIPNVYSEDVAEYVYTMIDFLANRYGENNMLDGIIVGSCIDDIEIINSVGEITVDKYAELYTTYLVIVSNAIRKKNSAADVVIPLSDQNDYTETILTERAINASKFLDRLFYRLDKNVSGEFYCSVLVESEITPLGITNSNIGSGIDTQYKTDKSKLNVDNIGDLQAFLNSLSEKYNDVPQNIIYMWHSNNKLSGDALCCAYMYLYNTLAKSLYISAFIADFGNNFASAEKVFKYADTEKCQSSISSLSRYFSDTSWMEASNVTTRTLIEKEMLINKPDGIIGEFQYLDFTSSSAFNAMNKGEHCLSVGSEYDAVGTRSLRISTDSMKVGDIAECIGLFEYSEDYRYTPYISLSIAVSDNKVSDGALYEIILTLGKDKSRVEAVGVVKNHEKAELYFDISEFSQISTADYITVSVRCITDATDGMSIWLYDLNGYSNLYTSQELSEYIEALRLADSDGADNDGKFDYTVIFTVMGILFAIGAVGIGLLMVFRREDESEKNTDLKNKD